jgi:coenzyme F420 hydrogenase subunit beta
MTAAACRDLEKRVIKENLCTLCGACTGLCPYLVAHRGRIVLRDECSLPHGRCRSFCPRLSVDLEEIHKATFGVPCAGGSLGNVLEVLKARSTDGAIRSKAQYGGAVTALMSFAMKEGFIDSSVLTRGILPEGICAGSEKQVLECAGSTYIAAPVIGVFNAAVREGRGKKIGVVGTPCQILALAKMRTAQENRDAAENLSLTLGLFCTWALSYDELIRFLEERVPLSEIARLDIPPPPANLFEIFTTSGRISVPLDEVRRFIRPACAYCIDMTAEFADISVGAAEGIDGWNTVIVRSPKGAELLRKAITAGVLEAEALPERNIEHLKEASLLKKKRGLENIVERTGKASDLLYIEGSSALVKEEENRGPH